MSEPGITLTLTFASRADLVAYLGADTIEVEEIHLESMRTDATVDGDGMPYDAEVHSTPPSFTAGGMWRAKKGKAAQAEAARAAFKAKGGPIAAPVAPVAPVAPPAPAPALGLPGMPAVAAVARAPVTMEMVAERINNAMTAGTTTADAVGKAYASLGITQLSMLETNESLRAALYDLF